MSGASSPAADALAAFAERVPPERIERVWLFPPRKVGERDSALAVFTLLPEVGERRPILTLRYEVARGGGKAMRTDVVQEQGSAPAERVQRVIEGVVRRLGGETALPDAVAVEGLRERWNELLDRLREDRAP